jgi:hypothetical protein
VLVPFLALALVLGVTATSSPESPVRPAYVPALEVQSVPPALEARCPVRIVTLETTQDGTWMFLVPNDCREA